MKSKKMITGKIVSAALIFALSASLTACGSNTENNTDKATQNLLKMPEHPLQILKMLI